MADNYFGNLARATLGQGLAMEWGDELEARIRTLSGDETYEEELNMINKDYAQFAKENPKTVMAAELGGAFVPTIASLFMPALAPAAAAKNVGILNKLRKFSKTDPIKTSAGVGAVVGGVAGAGGANPGDRTAGGITGAGFGLGIGAATPVVFDVGKGVYNAGKNLFGSVSDAQATQKAVDLIAEQIPAEQAERSLRQMEIDQQNKVPSIFADSTDGSVQKLKQLKQADLADNSRAIDEKIGTRNQEAGERVIEKLNQQTGGTNYYTRLDDITSDLKNEASPLYGEAYAIGEINDPQLLEIITTNPSFRRAYQEAKDMIRNDRDNDILNGGDGSAFTFPDLDAGELPTVELLDKIKLGVDAVLEPRVGDKALGTQAKAGLRRLKNVFLSRIDDITRNPETGISPYEQARGIYSSGSANRQALEDGKENFLKLAPEQVKEALATMNLSEAAGFRVGAIRSMIDKINKPKSSGSGSANPTKEVTLGSRNTRDNVKELFPGITEGGFDLFDAVLKRENQLFNNTVRVLNAGSSTAGNLKGQLKLADETGAFDPSIVNQSAGQTLISYVTKLISAGSVPSKVQKQMAKMLLDDDPIKVAASVEAIKRSSMGAMAKDEMKSVRNITNAFGTNVAARQMGPLGTSYAPTQEDIDTETRRRRLAFGKTWDEYFKDNMIRKEFPDGDGTEFMMTLPLDQQQ